MYCIIFLLKTNFIGPESGFAVGETATDNIFRITRYLCVFIFENDYFKLSIAF